jgi:type IV pilus assembly protein PilY1
MRSPSCRSCCATDGLLAPNRRTRREQRTPRLPAACPAHPPRAARSRPARRPDWLRRPDRDFRGPSRIEDHGAGERDVHARRLRLDVLGEHPRSTWFRVGIYLFPRPANVYDWRTGATDYPADPVSTDLDDPNARFYRSYAGNPLYYNPEKTYKPWSNSDGSLWPNAEPTRAWLNPGHPNRDDYTLDLTQNLLWRPPPDNSNVAEATIYPATYFAYTGSAPLVRTDTTTTNTPGNFTRVQIGLTTLPTRSPKRTDCAGDPCSYAEEIKNFANWFSYHRSRHLAARAAIGKAFSEQKDNLRVGYATINRTTETDIDGFTTKRVVRGLRLFKDEEASDKRWRTQFFDWLYKDPMPRLGTPLRTAMDDVGNYFTSSPPWRAKVEDSTSAALSCQRSHHILMTDGYYDNDGDSARASISGSNVDNLEGDEHTSEDGTRSFSYLPAAPYKDDYTNTLADVAMYYWKTDLRPGSRQRHSR